jgi:hypothetical protein
MNQVDSKGRTCKRIEEYTESKIFPYIVYISNLLYQF